MNRVVVLSDNSEKRPIKFPQFVRSARTGKLCRVEVIEKCLKHVACDYRLDGDSPVGIERKGTPEEIYSCVFGDRKEAFENQLSRLAARYKRPILLLETTPYELRSYNWAAFARHLSPHTEMPEDTGQLLLQELTAMTGGVSIVWLGRSDSHSQWWALGELVVALLLGGRMGEKNGVKTPA